MLSPDRKHDAFSGGSRRRRPSRLGGERAGCVLALLSGDLDLASAPDLREEFLGMLTGLSRHLATFATAGEAIAGRHTITSMGDAETGIRGYALA
jgi:hypothetical protein